MSDGSPTVLVIGATGNIGGAVARALLSKGRHVRTISRNPEVAKALQLSEQGVEVLKGDLNDPASFEAAMTGMDTVFAVTTPHEVGPQGETEQGIAIVDAAKSASVGHLIYSSVGSADQQTGIPHFESKAEIERTLADSGIPYSISAPVFVLENFLSPWNLPELQKGSLKLALPADRKLQVISFREVGEFGAALVERRESVFGQRYDIAADELTGEETAAIFSRASGRKITYAAFDPEVFRADNDDMADMFVWFDKVGYRADVDRLRRDFPEVDWQTTQEWAQQQDWSILA